MTTKLAGTAEEPDVGSHWLATISSLVFGAGFLALWFWLLPLWLGFRVEITGAARWRWIVALPSALGFAIALRCVWDFGWTGRGTPAPFAPPKKLVVVGPYRFVRNPMYLGFFLGWIGLWVIFGKTSLAAIVGACAVILCVALFVMLYEEPTLRKSFGDDYKAYCSNVRRWIPRIHPWNK